jgi:hypothetical protein
MQVNVLIQNLAVRQQAVRKTGLVFGTEDRPIFSEGAPDFWGHVMLKSLHLFTIQLIFTVLQLKLKINTVE